MGSPQDTSPTADPKELDFFKNISSVWWDKTGPLKSLHSMNYVRVPLVLDGLVNAGVVKKEVIDTPEPLKGLLILEAGCGGGIFSEALAKLGANVVGVDPSPELIEQAKQHAALNPALSNLKYVLESAEEHARNNHEKYDVVVASQVLEHVRDHKIFLEACVKCLKPEGSIFLTTQTKNMISWFAATFLPKYVLHNLPHGIHEHGKLISPQETRTILENYNCETKSVRGMFYNFLTGNWHWFWTILYTYGLHAVKDGNKKLE